MLSGKTEKTTTIRVVLCDDDPIILEAFQEQLEFGRSPFGPAVQVAACQSVDEALALSKSFGPDLLLIDLYICDERFAGIKILDAFAKRCPSARRIAMTAHGSRLSEGEIRRLAACRLDGFLDKSIGVNSVLQACHRIWQGEVIIASPFATRFTTVPSQGEQQAKTLSSREHEVLILRAQSHRIRDISRQLGISESSVSTLLERIAGKIGSKHPADLLSWCRTEGLIS